MGMAESYDRGICLPSGIFSKIVAVWPEFDHTVGHRGSRKGVASVVSPNEGIDVLGKIGFIT